MSERIISSFDGTQLYTKTETTPNDKAIVVIVHGLCEHQGRYDYFAEKLHEAGYGTVNLPGGLVDHFAETVLLYGVRIGAAGLQKGTDDLL